MNIILIGTTRIVFNKLMALETDRLANLTLKELAEECGISEDTAGRHVRALRALSLVEVQRPKRGVPYSFELTRHAYALGYKVG